MTNPINTSYSHFKIKIYQIISCINYTMALYSSCFFLFDKYTYCLIISLEENNEETKISRDDSLATNYFLDCLN